MKATLSMAQLCDGEGGAEGTPNGVVVLSLWINHFYWEVEREGVTTLPFWPCFWPSSSSFSHQVHTLLKSLCKKTTKTSYKTRYPLGTKYYKERGISNYSAGVALQLTPRFTHISSSDPSTARSSLEGPATRSSRQSSTYSRMASTAAVVNSSRGWIR